MKNTTMKHSLSGFEKKDGASVVLVAILILVFTVALGILGLQQSSMGARIEGNHKAYEQDYYEVECGITVFEQNFVDAANNLGEDTTKEYTVDDDNYDSGIKDNVVKAKFTKTGKPIDNKGFSADQFKARYYQVNSQQNGIEVEAGVWKAYPNDNLVVLQ